jgi:DNA-binding CsgD family transcriptional regulator
VTDDVSLRPIERRILRLVDDGVAEEEIARRFRRSPDMIRRLIALAEVPRSQPAGHPAEQLRPLERRVLRWRESGAPYGEIGSRFRRSAAHVERVEGLARYKLSRAT